MRVIVCGGRGYSDITHVAQVLTKLHRERGISVVIQGGATGADKIAREWAGHNDVKSITYAAQWGKHGRSAGPIRNQRMVDEGKPDLVIAFPGGRGTASMVRCAKLAGVPVKVCKPTTIH